MTANRSKGNPRKVLAVLILLGVILAIIPFFLKPPAFLDLILRDSVFQSDLTGKSIRVTDDASGSSLVASIQKIDGDFLAPVGRIDSGKARSFTVEIEGYKPSSSTIEAPPMQKVRAAVNLVPTFGRLEVSVVNSAHDGQPVVALVKEGSSAAALGPQSALTLDLPPGTHRLSGQAAGFCSGEREYRVEEGRLTRVKLPLTPDLTDNEIARFVLDWGENPRDLDAHLRKLGMSGLPDQNHVYFKHKEIQTNARQVFARLDVDQQNSEGYETVTVYDKAAGDYEFYVHLYAGDGTLGEAGATVEAFTSGCQRKLFTVPADCTGSIWAVTLLRANQGRTELFGQQKCIGLLP